MMPFFDGATEGVLHSVAKVQVQSSVYVQSGSTFSSKFHTEVALIVIKMLNFLPEEIRNMAGDKWTGFVLAPVYENTFLFRMGVKIDEHKDTSVLEDCSLCKENLRAVDFVIVVPDSVEIIA